MIGDSRLILGCAFWVLEINYGDYANSLILRKFDCTHKHENDLMCLKNHPQFRVTFLTRLHLWLLIFCCCINLCVSLMNVVHLRGRSFSLGCGRGDRMKLHICHKWFICYLQKTSHNHKWNKLKNQPNSTKTKVYLLRSSFFLLVINDIMQMTRKDA